MITEASIDPMLSRFFDVHTLDKPMPITKILAELRSNKDAGLEALIRNAFKLANPESRAIDNVKIQYIHGGSSVYVFKVQPETQNGHKPLVMQIARGDALSRQGMVVEQDYKNLRLLEKLVGRKYFPKVFGEKGRITLHGLANAPVIFTEFLDGYYELDFSRAYGRPGLFRTRYPELGDCSINVQGSKLVMEEIIHILAYVFAKTYNPRTNKGKLIHGIKLQASDFMWRDTEDDSQPMVKMVTARAIDEVHPREFLFYLLSEIGTFDGMELGVGLFYFMVQEDKSPIKTIVNGIMSGLKEAYRRKAKEIFKDWVSDYSAHIRDDVAALFQGISDGRISSFEEISAGYRTMVKCYALSHYSNKIDPENRRPLSLDDLDELFPFVQHTRDVILQKVVPDRLRSLARYG